MCVNEGVVAVCEERGAVLCELQDQKCLHVIVGNTTYSGCTQCERQLRTSGVVSVVEGRGRVK